MGAEAQDIWELSGSALRLAIDLGYHHERVGGTYCDRLEEDMRRRLFWSCVPYSPVDV
jgi:hypothetical protein